MKKIIISAAIVLLAIATMVAVTININNGKAKKELLAKSSAMHTELTIKKNVLKEERGRYVALRDAETKLGAYIVLFFDNLDENLINVVYPMLNERGLKATIVMCNGLIPGEEGNISRASFDFLLRNGWDTAIGYSDEITPEAENAPELLAKYLDEYIAKLEEKNIDIPVTYCFDKGGYDQKFESVLKERGFKVIRHFAETKEKFGGSYSEDEFYYIGTGLYCAANTNLQKDVDEAYENELAYSISVRYVSDSPADKRLDCTVDKYKRLLSYLETGASGIAVGTISELCEHKREQLESAEGIVGKYNLKIAEIDKQIAEIDKQMKEILERIE